MWNAIKVGRTGPEISHVFFADDLLLMGEALAKQAMTIKNILMQFCNKSGQCVNNSKSRLWFSPNTEKKVIKQLSRTIGMLFPSDLGIYLGVPVHHSRLRKYDYEYLIAKVRKRLGGWQGKILSMGARALLIQIVTASIPLYAMQTSLIPKVILMELEKNNCGFLWGFGNGERKCHPLSWSAVCHSKNTGGAYTK